MVGFSNQLVAEAIQPIALRCRPVGFSPMRPRWLARIAVAPAGGCTRPVGCARAAAAI